MVICMLINSNERGVSNDQLRAAVDCLRTLLLVTGRVNAQTMLAADESVLSWRRITMADTVVASNLEPAPGFLGRIFGMFNIFIDPG